MASYRFPIESLPSEIKHQICSYLSQKKLHALILTSKALSGAAAISLYRVPRFLSTYRFAQFVTTISHSRHYADMVRSFNLWDSHEGENQIDELASWMEWKYRSVPLYAARLPPAPLCKQVKRDSKRVMHPRCNEFLSKSSCSRGIPVGAIVHVLSACKNLRRVNLHFKPILEDFVIMSAAFPATATSSMICVSDVPRSWTHTSKEVHSISTDSIIQHLTNLPHLERLDIRNSKWLSTDNVESILFGCQSLTKINFLGSGNIVDDPNSALGGPGDSSCWAVKGSKEEIAEMLGSVRTPVV